jgi:hypothetical protein
LEETSPFFSPSTPFVRDWSAAPFRRVILRAQVALRRPWSRRTAAKRRVWRHAPASPPK